MKEKKNLIEGKREITFFVQEKYPYNRREQQIYSKNMRMRRAKIKEHKRVK